MRRNNKNPGNNNLERLPAEPDEPFSWDIDEQWLPALYRAAASYVRRAPWFYMPGDIPIELKLSPEYRPAAGVDTLYASIMGQGGMVIGIAFYFSLEDLRQALSRGQEQQGRDEPVEEMIELLRRKGAPIDKIPPPQLYAIVADLMEQKSGSPISSLTDSVEQAEDSLVVFYGPLQALDQSYVQWLKERGLKYASRQTVPDFYRTKAGEMGRATLVEVKALTLALEMLSRFFSDLGIGLQNPQIIQMLLERASVLRHKVAIVPPQPETIGASKAAAPLSQTAKQPKQEFEVIFPPADSEWTLADLLEDYRQDLEDDQEEAEIYADEAAPTKLRKPLSPAAATTLYRFQVILEWRTKVWRRIELRGDQTLDDLHQAIQAAFGWYNDHLYAFFLNNRAWEQSSEYSSPDDPEARRPANRYALAQLNWQAGQHLLYVFDFGDEITHHIVVEAIEAGGVVSAQAYPHMVEKKGKAPAQYSYRD